MKETAKNINEKNTWRARHGRFVADNIACGGNEGWDAGTDGLFGYEDRG